jgi:hypothetical protein
MGGKELLVIGIGGEAHRQDVQVRLPDPGHLHTHTVYAQFLS